MTNESHDELFLRAQEIVEQYRDPVAQAEILDELQRKGLLDDHLQVVFPANGHSPNPVVDDQSAKS